MAGGPPPTSGPRPSGRASGAALLIRWALASVAAAALWMLLLSWIFRIPLTPEVLSGDVQVPALATDLHVAGLYALLLGLAAWTWRRAGERLAPVFSAGLLLEGVLLGLFGAALVSVAQHFLGLGDPRWAALESRVLPGAAAGAAFFAVSEEALFRGFMLPLLLRDLSLRPAVWISAAIFATLHFLRPIDPVASLIPFATLLGAGALLAACRLRTGSIWLGVGLHASWIWYYASGFGRDAGPLALAGLCLAYAWVRWRHP